MDKVSLSKSLFYQVKPVIPRRTQLWLRRQRAAYILKEINDNWPILRQAVAKPLNWQGWPNNKQFSVVLSHDVEWDIGRDRCLQVMELERSLGFRSCFNFVPERYPTSHYIREKLKENGCEIGVHGLKHDGKLYHSHDIFQERAAKINDYLDRWGAVGVHTPARHHQLEWNHAWHVEYVSSTFDIDPFEPQSDGVGTIFPFTVTNAKQNESYVEIPYTMPQDHCLFIILQKPNVDIWKQKVDWIAENGGMVFVIAHPDYMADCDSQPGLEEYQLAHYKDFLMYLKQRYERYYWQALPCEVAQFWKSEKIKTQYDQTK